MTRNTFIIERTQIDEACTADIKRLEAEIDLLQAEINKLQEAQQVRFAECADAVRECEQRYLDSAPYKVGQIVRATDYDVVSQIERSEFKITRVGLNWDSHFEYYGVARTPNDEWNQHTSRLGDIEPITEEK